MDLIGKDLAGWRIEKWHAMGDEEIYFKDEDLAREVARMCNVREAYLILKSLVVLTKDGKTGFVVVEEGDLPDDKIVLQDEKKIKRDILKHLKETLSPMQRKVLGLE